MLELYNKFKDSVNAVRDIPPLAFRLLLSYVFFGPAMMKLGDISSTTMWFDSLGIPLPTLNAYLATFTETAGFVLLFIGLGTRLISVPLIFTMIVAFFTVHMDNGWSVIGQSVVPEIGERMEMARSILREYGNYEWLTAKGGFVILQNGIENVVTYTAMLMALVVYGPGRISVDALIETKSSKKS